MCSCQQKRTMFMKRKILVQEAERISCENIGLAPADRPGQDPNAMPIPLGQSVSQLVISSAKTRRFILGLIKIINQQKSSRGRSSTPQLLPSISEKTETGGQAVGSTNCSATYCWMIPRYRSVTAVWQMDPRRFKFGEYLLPVIGTTSMTGCSQNKIAKIPNQAKHCRNFVPSSFQWTGMMHSTTVAYFFVYNGRVRFLHSKI